MNYDDCLYVSCKVPSKALICEGDILICARNGSRSLVGKCAIVDKNGMAFGAFMAKFSSRFNQYIKIFLDSPVFRCQLEGVKTETINQITQEMLKNQLVPLPPLSEQEKIVAKIEELIPHIDEYDTKESKISALNTAFPEQLKKSILQEAVQGKLVPQDPTDEPASVLLERIREEKARLVKDGKIKKDKNESVIFRRDNSYYEKSNGVERCINAELPFEIPDSWCWARLKQLGITQTGNTPSKNHKEYFGDYIPFIGPGNISEHGIISSDKGLSLQGLEFGRLVKAGSILQVCIGGSIGKAAINQVDVTFNQQINSITPIACCKEYLFCAITAPYFIKIIKERAGGTATPIINRGEWDNILIPLAPLKEQNKIVATVKSATNFLRF